MSGRLHLDRNAFPSLLVPLLALCFSCASSPIRFDRGGVITRVDDTHNIEEPAEIEFYRIPHHLNNFIDRQIRLGLDPVPPPPAEDVNRLGEVPNSSWYENRTGQLSPSDVGRGPGGEDRGPEPYKPWAITGMKSGGRNPGFLFEDSRGVRYICKFDKRGEPVVATAAGVISNRLLWASGYHVPDDRIVFFERADLNIGEGATRKLPDGTKVPIERSDIDHLLESTSTQLQDGSYRVLVSRFLPGRPVGGYSYRGTRKDDPNDTIPHQNRRSLRALRVFGAWLNHVDLKVDNTLDLFTREEDRQFIRHYLVDFDGCLGGYWAARHEERIGSAYELDLAELVTGVPQLGLLRRPYENQKAPIDEEIGLFEADIFDPAAWKPNYLNDQLSSCTAADAFWAGTILAQIDEERIRHAVVCARYSEEATVHRMTRILEERRVKTLDWALRRVTPVTGLHNVENSAAGGGFRIPASNAILENNLPSDVRFETEILDAGGNRIGGKLVSVSAEVVVADDLVRDLDYVIIRWIAEDSRGRRLPPSEGHYIREDGSWRPAGILRDGE